MKGSNLCCECCPRRSSCPGATCITRWFFSVLKEKPVCCDIKELGGIPDCDLERPSDGLIATRFLHGLEDSRYASLKTYLGNELANGRDLYQSDLDGAASQATRWLVHGNKTPNSLPTPPVVNSFIADKGTAKKPRKRQEKQPKVEEPVQHSDETCDFCKRKGHSQAKCFKYAAASKAAVEEAAAKKEKHSKRALGPVAGAMLATTHDDSGDETPLHKLTYHVTSLILGGSMKLSPYDIVRMAVS